MAEEYLISQGSKSPFPVPCLVDKVPVITAEFLELDPFLSRDLSWGKHSHAIEKGYPLGADLVGCGPADLGGIGEGSRLDGVNQNYLEPGIVEEVEYDPEVVSSGLHNDNGLGSQGFPYLLDPMEGIQHSLMGMFHPHWLSIGLVEGVNRLNL